MMPDTENRLWPWAKLRRQCKEGRGDRCRRGCDCPVSGALSLIGHSADVAACMHALLGQLSIARRLGRLLGQPALTSRDRAAPPLTQGSTLGILYPHVLGNGSPAHAGIGPQEHPR